MNDSKVFGFQPDQISKLMATLGRYEVYPILSDSDASDMFSEVIIQAFRHLSDEQVEELQWIIMKG